MAPPVGWTERQEDGLRWIDLRLPALPWRVSVCLMRVDGLPQILGLRLVPRSDVKVSDTVLSAARLRALPFREIRTAALAALNFDVDELRASVRRLSDDTSSDEHYRTVADTYRAAVAAGRPPRPTIANVWGRSLGAADLWIAEARTRGHLEPAAKGRTS